MAVADGAPLGGLLRESAHVHAFLDLRAPARGGEWLREPLEAGFLGHGAMRSVWPDHLDGVSFLRRMPPATPVDRAPSGR